MKKTKNIEVKHRHAAVVIAQARNSAGFMGDRRKKRSKERSNLFDGW